MTTPGADQLPDQYDELIGADELAWDAEYNVRKAVPSTELIESIRSTGIKYALTVRPAPDRDIYLIADGWQRYQAGVQVGYETLPCDVYETERALVEARRASINDEWTLEETIKHHVSVYQRYREQGLSKQEAIERTTDTHEIHQSTLWRYRRAYALPPLARSLLKPPEKRTDDEWQQLQKFDPEIKRYQSRLPIDVAARLGKLYTTCDLEEKQVIETAVVLLGVETDIALAVIDGLEPNPDRNPEELLTSELVTDTTTNGVIRLPQSIVTDEEIKGALERHCQQTRRPLADVITELLEDFVEDEMAPIEQPLQT